MSIKSDNWIRRMAEQHKMIEPFEAEQVRFSGENRVISYGTSSYGYDVRCANEFKVFTNVHSKPWIRKTSIMILSSIWWAITALFHRIPLR